MIQKAKQRGVGVVVMKTLMGARLNDMRPYERDRATFAQAAFRWVLSNPNVDGLIVSMTSRESIDEYLGASGSRTTGADDLPLLERYARINGTSYCKHACDECEGACPAGVAISEVMRTRMYAVDYGDLRMAKDEYAMIGRNAAACLSCSAKPCAGACPHGSARSAHRSDALPSESGVAVCRPLRADSLRRTGVRVRLDVLDGRYRLKTADSGRFGMEGTPPLVPGIPGTIPLVAPPVAHEPRMSVACCIAYAFIMSVALGSGRCVLPANDEAASERRRGGYRADGPAAAGLGNLLAIAEHNALFAADC